MILDACLVGLVVMLAKFFDWYGTTYFSRPLVCVSLLGFVLGQPTEGIILGAQLELVFLGNISLGGGMASDFTLGSLIGAAFSLLLGQNIGIAILLAIPFSMLGTLLYSGIKRVVSSLVPRFDKHIDNGDINSFRRLWFLQLMGYVLVYFFIGFTIILVGTELVRGLLELFPDWLQASLSVVAKLLPALGLALLLKMFWTKSSAAYYFLGFALGAFFFYNETVGVTLTDGVASVLSAPTKILSLVQITFIGGIIAAIVVYQELSNNKKRDTQVVSKKVSDESEDFFND